MKYMLMIYVNQKEWQTATQEEREAVYAAHRPFHALLKERDALVETQELRAPDQAITLREGHRTDGPFVETVEHLGGYYVVDVRDLDEAIELAKMLPEAAVEVRPIAEYEG